MEIKLARYKISSIKDNKRLYGVISNGFDNLYSDYLNGLYNNSVTHQSVVNDLVGYTMGSGLKAESEQDQQILDNFFPKKKLRQILTLKEIQQTISLEAIKSKAGNIVELNCLNPAQIRVKQVEDGKPTEFWYRKSWDRQDTTNYRISQVFENIELTNQFEGLFYWFDSGTFPVYYGRPRYMGGLNAIELEIAIYMMHNHGAQNGMFPSMIIAKPSSGDPEQDKADTKETQRQLVGPANAGKIVTTYFPNGGTAPQFSTPNLTGLDKIYENQYEVAESGILKAHSVPSPLLIAGLNQKSGGFGSLEEELEWAKQEMFKKLVLPKREEFLEIMQPIFRKIGIQGEVDFEDVEESNGGGAVVPTNETEMENEVNDNLKNMTGRQLQGFERAIKRFNDGKWTYEQTKSYLKKAYALADEDIDDWITKPEELSELANPSDNVALNEFIQLGEQEQDLGDYDLILADRLDGKPYEPDFNEAISLAASVPSSSWQKVSDQDTPLFKVRYRYGGSPVGEREFCNKLVRSNKVFRKEDITQLESQRINPGFGPNGSDTYNVWFYKGGPNCQHFWERRIYMRRNNRPISVNQARSIISDLPVDERDDNRIEANPRQVARRPEDMPNNGYLNPRMSKQEKTKSTWETLKDYFNGGE